MCPVKGLLAPYDRKQPVYGLVAYVVDDESVRLSFFPLFLRILPRLRVVCKQSTLVPESCSCGTQPVWLAYCRAVLKRVKFLVSRIMADAVTHEMPGTVRANEAFSMNSGSCISCSRISFSSLRMASFMPSMTLRKAFTAGRDSFDRLPEKFFKATSQSFSFLLVR